MKNSSPLDRSDAEKLQHLLTADAEGLFQLLQDPDTGLLAVLLKNPQFKEEHLLTLLKRRDLPEALIEAIHRKHQKAISHRLVVALVKNPSAPGHLVRSLLPQLRLFELVDLCFLPGATPDQKLAAERAIMQRLPTTPLGNKITLARRGTANIVAELLKEGHPQLVEVCLTSPRIKESAIFQFLRGPFATAETISMVARHNRWQHNPNLQLAILKNRKTPNIWFTLWLPKIRLQLLKQLHLSYKNDPVKRQLFETELKKRGLK